MRATLAFAMFTFSICAGSNHLHAQTTKVCQNNSRDNWQKSVVIAEKDIEILKLNPHKFDFSFSNTIKTILQSAGLDANPGGQVVAVQSLLDTFDRTSETHPLSSRKVTFTRREAEFKLKAEDLLSEASADGMVPIGLFNRFDQAPISWAYCGEHRIVYAKKSQSSFNRFFLIFEAAVANPRPEFGREGCRAIANMWQSLKSETNKEIIAKKLHDFYYKGIPGADPSELIPPVLHVKHFGNPYGQVRGNVFVEEPWQLREWRIDPLTGNFKIFTVGTNPQPALYGSSGPNGSLDPRIVRGFQSVFVRSLVPQLTLADEIRSKAEPQDEQSTLITSIAVLGDAVAQWNDFVSNSQTPHNEREDNPKTVSVNAVDFRKEIKNALDDIPSITDKDVTVDQILSRAGVTSCGGCHQFSTAETVAIGRDKKEIKWPGSLGFVHIDEDSRISPLLKNFLLADRCEKMNDLFFKASPPAPPPPPGGVSLITALRHLPATAIFDLQRQISVTQLEPGLKAALGRAAESSIPTVRALDRGSLGALGQIRHSD